MKSFLSLLLCGLTCILSAYDFPVPPKFLSDLGGAQAIRRTFSNAAKAVKSGDDGSFAFTYNTKDNKYAGISIILKQPLTIKPGEALLFDVRSTQAPGGIYCRLYQQGSRKPVWGFSNWKRVAGKEWITLTAQQGGSPDLLWEDKGVDLTAKPEKIARIEIIIGDHTKETADFSVELRNFRIGKATPKVTELARPATLSRQTDLTGKVTILHPATPAGEAAAKTVAAALPHAAVRPGTAADRITGGGHYILLGHVFNNPAMLPLYARYQCPADESFPGKGNYFISNISEAYRTGQDVIAVGASDDQGLNIGAAELAKAIRDGKNILDAAFFATNRAIPPLPANHIENGLKTAQHRLDNGTHTSLGGHLSVIGQSYVQNHRAADAKLYVEVCRLYDKSAVPDARKFGGAWGFDSDFPSFQALNCWDIVEHDPSLTDEDRLAVTRCLARWLTEAIVYEATSGLYATGSVHNHLTFCTQGTLAGALYFGKYFPELREPAHWMQIVRHNFARQSTSMKAIDDCNGYQWLVWEHLMNFSNAMPDDTFISSGTGTKVLRSMLLTMDNYGLQVPYGDTGSWKCWLSEIPVLQRYVAAIDDPLAKYILARKRAWGIRKAPNDYYCELPEQLPEPAGFFGVQKLELEPKFYASMNEPNGLPLEKCFDKISFRDSFAPADLYLLIDGINNGNHRHADGNSVLRHTQYDRIWLADNDYFKSQQKFHNTLLITGNGAAGAMKPYIELLGYGNDKNTGWYAGRSADLAGTDWVRYIVWLKAEQAYAVLDVVRANEPLQLQLKQRWHSLGTVTPTADGAIFEQNGPAMRFQGFATNSYRLADDRELGTNWAGYPHARTVVRVLDQIDDLQIKQGDVARIGGVWHGAADGKIAPWRVESTDQGMIIDTGKNCYTIAGDTDGNLKIATTASAGPVAEPVAGQTAKNTADGSPMEPLWTARQAGQSTTCWYTDPQYRKQFKPVLTGTEPAGPNLLIPETVNKAASLLDGSWVTSDDSCMLGPDQIGDWTITFNQPLNLTCLQLLSWWAHTSTRQSQHLIQTITVYVDGKKVAEKDLRREQLPNFVAPIAFRLDFPAVKGTAVRVVITPRPGSRLYPSELRVGGIAPETLVPATLPCTAAADFAGDLLVAGGEGVDTVLSCYSPDGKLRWQKQVPDNGTINDIATGDIDGDGKPEIALAGQGARLTVLNNDGTYRWHRQMEFYRVPPLVTLTRIADINGDGKPEILAGCDNWRTYAFTADGKLLWHYEVVHPTRALMPADINDDGKMEILCGTKYYSMSVLDHEGNRLWYANFGPGCRGVDAIRHADGKKRVVATSDDGTIRFFTNTGKSIAVFNTGDEVRNLAVTPGKGVQTAWAGSFNGLVYHFDADGKLLQYRNAGSAVTALAALPDGGAVAGTVQGAVIRFAADGSILSRTQLNGQITEIVRTGDRFAAVSAKGDVAIFAALP